LRLTTGKSQFSVEGQLDPKAKADRDQCNSCPCRDAPDGNGLVGPLKRFRLGLQCRNRSTEQNLLDGFLEQ
jgi:hypothetical protein